MELTTKDKHVIAMCLFTTKRVVKHPECEKDVNEVAENIGITKELEDVEKKYHSVKKKLNGLIDKLEDLITDMKEEDHAEDPLIDAILKASKNQKPDQN
jgi:quinolinate synthase